MLDALMPRGPGEGPQWERLATWLHDRIVPGQVDGIWVMRTLRRDRREYGAAILSLVEGDRRRICTANYIATIKGKTRGGFEASMTEVGSGPLEALHELLAMVPVRSDDEDPPTPIPVATWFPPAQDDADAGPDAEAVSAEAVEPEVAEPEVVTVAEDGIA